MNTNNLKPMSTVTRKTAAEKRAEAAELRLREQQAEEAKFNAEYQGRLLTLVHAYVSELTPLLEATGTGENSEFVFRVSYYTNLRLPLFRENDLRSVEDLREEMEEAERFLKNRREERRLAEERAAKKSAALAKLDADERELLGL